MDAKLFRRLLRKDQTQAEKILWYALRAKRFQNTKFRRQHSIAQYVVDFYCASCRLVIEVDGSVHDNIGQHYYDMERDQKLEFLGYKVLRFDNDNVIQQLENVLEEIEKHLNYAS